MQYAVFQRAVCRLSYHVKTLPERKHDVRLVNHAPVSVYERFLAYAFPVLCAVYVRARVCRFRHVQCAACAVYKLLERAGLAAVVVDAARHVCRVNHFHQVGGAVFSAEFLPGGVVQYVGEFVRQPLFRQSFPLFFHGFFAVAFGRHGSFVDVKHFLSFVFKSG